MHVLLLAAPLSKLFHTCIPLSYSDSEASVSSSIHKDDQNRTDAHARTVFVYNICLLITCKQDLKAKLIMYFTLNHFEIII